MNKYITTVMLLAISSVSFANATQAGEEISISSVRNFQVIINNEVIANNTCRLSFESGKTKDVLCNTKNK